MEWSLTKALLWGLVVFLQIQEHKGCFEEERIGLLKLTVFLKSNTYENYLLPSWSDNSNSDCCDWEGVTCNCTTGRVIELSLGQTDQSLEYYYHPASNGTHYEERWLLNVSLFMPFTELTSLDLSYNGIGGWLPNEGFQKLSNLRNLRILNLGYNYFDDNNILQSVVEVVSLETLNLTHNWLYGHFSTQGLANLSRLETLDLQRNFFTGRISSHIGALTSLKAISLAHNNFSGTLPQELCGLVKLEELDLSCNFFKGIIPPCLKNLTSLRLLDISENQFFGSISSVAKATPKSIVYLNVGTNLFEGTFSFSLLANHSKLEVISIANHNNKLEIETENPMGWKPLFELKVLLLSNCNLNKLTKNIPSFLFNHHKVEKIDFSHNQLKGRFPIWLLEKNMALQRLNLRNNSFIGKFHLPIDSNLRLSWIDVSNNHFDGKLQEDIGQLSSILKYLNLSHNSFEGYLPSSLTKACHLSKLDLSFNNFFGELPKEWDHNCSNFVFLKLSNNQFNGTIPKSLLQISPFHFEISNNNMSGTIPIWTQNLSNITDTSLVLRNNSFEGPIPCELSSITFIDLSYNLISGSLPSCLNLENIIHLLLRGNKLVGSPPKSIFNSSSLLTLDLSNNNLFGSIPDEMGELSNLRILLLRGNHFSGIIPNKLCWLKNMDIMDLSQNLFFGSIPECFHNMSFGMLHNGDDAYRANFRLNYLLNVVGSSKTILHWDIMDLTDVVIYDTEQVGVMFPTKHRLDSYKGGILSYMSGLDLSCNKLTGQIPPKLTTLSSIHGLNLSYNQLTGPILRSFSNLVNLESLDLSHNNLSGELPLALTNMNFLEVFSVAYNNLSGRVPEMKAQFGTFSKSSYEGNPFLCGEPLENKCPTVIELHPFPKKSSHTKVDLQAFFPSFFATYVIFFLAITILLYINPH